MTRPARSIRARLVLGAALLTTVALMVAAVAIGLVLHRFVVGQIDRGLDDKIAAVASTLTEADGKVRLQPRLEAPPYDRPDSGWYWEVRVDDGATVARSTSLGDGRIEVFSPHFRWQSFWDFAPRPAEGKGPHGEPLHLRVRQVAVGSLAASVIVSAPQGAVARPLWDAFLPLAACLLILGIALVAANLLQVRIGLRPLAAIREALAGVRAGRAAALPLDQPAELRPLAEELNLLLEQNVAGLERARRNVSNLAHALKTPLATLSVVLEQPDTDRAALLAHVRQMERHIRHHLGRARTAALGGPARATSLVAEKLRDHAAMFARIHADRAIVFHAGIDTAAAVACEPQDLDEMLGNVLDNAFKWARSRVEARCRTDGTRLIVCIDDDGPGLRDDQVPEALLPGRRLDETIPGDGFGLAIARELAELYNGGIALRRSPLGGLRVEIDLPRTA